MLLVRRSRRMKTAAMRSRKDAVPPG
jgi:hypothetical protein